MKRFTTILWDVDGTLLDFMYAQNYALKKCFQTIGKPVTQEMIDRYSEINDSYWKKLERKEITREELLVARFQQFFREYGIVGVNVEQFRKEYEEGVGSVYSFLDDALTIVKSLQGNVKQYVVSNGVTQIQKLKLKHSGLLEVMDGIFISQQVGADKPDKAFFAQVFSEIPEKDLDKILIVGDSLTSDIKGGKAAGITTCWYHREDDVSQPVPAKDEKPDYEIQDLHQIYQVLEIFREG